VKLLIAPARFEGQCRHDDHTNQYFHFHR
jgi:hypothetical protein